MTKNRTISLEDYLVGYATRTHDEKDDYSIDAFMIGWSYIGEKNI